VVDGGATRINLQVKRVRVPGDRRRHHRSPVPAVQPMTSPGWRAPNTPGEVPAAARPSQPRSIAPLPRRPAPATSEQRSGPRRGGCDTHLMAIEPWSDTGLNDNNGSLSPTIEVILAKVPAGKLLVVEHISGELAVLDGGVVNFIQAAGQYLPGGVVYLPVHFVSSVAQFSAAPVAGRDHQFGSPARLYVRGGYSVVVSGGATISNPDPRAAIKLFASAIGYLVDD